MTDVIDFSSLALNRMMFQKKDGKIKLIIQKKKKRAIAFCLITYSSLYLCFIVFLSKLINVTAPHKSLCLSPSVFLSVTLPTVDLLTYFINVQSRTGLKTNFHARTNAGTNIHCYLSIHLSIYRSERGEKRKDMGGVVRQLPQPSYNVIEAIHHIKIIRQQHGPPDQNSHTLPYALSCTHLSIHILLLETQD